MSLSPKEEPDVPQPQSRFSCHKLFIFVQTLNDKIQFYKTKRWIVIALLALIYMCRLIITQGYYALTYCIGIHLLNSFIGFISPLDDPEENEIDDTEGSFLPERNSEEFRPFARKIKEFHFWHAVFWPLFIGIILTFFDAFDIPVFWPLLLFYFIVLFFLTMKKQISNMIRYNYLPWDTGKKKYGVSPQPT